MKQRPLARRNAQAELRQRARRKEKLNGLHRLYDLRVAYDDAYAAYRKYIGGDLGKEAVLLDAIENAKCALDAHLDNAVRRLAPTTTGGK